MRYFKTHKPRCNHFKRVFIADSPSFDIFRSYHPEYSDTHQNIELKHGWAGFVLRLRNRPNPVVEGFCSLLPFGFVVTASREIAKHNGKHNHGFGFGFGFEKFFCIIQTSTPYTMHERRAWGSVAVAHDHPRIDPRDLFVPRHSPNAKNTMYTAANVFYLLPYLTVFSASNWSGS